MKILKKYEKEIDSLIESALREDVGPGDITTELLVPTAAEIKGVFEAKEKGILCGLPIAKKVFMKIDPDIKMVFKKKDGDRIKDGEIIATVRGKARAILSGERLALNILQRLSGVATETARFVEIAKPYKAAILDTRKTTPNFRIFEKYAVRTGGGQNHRMGLYDAVIIKDNHLMIIDLEKAVTEMRRFIPKNMLIEIEVDTLDILDKVIKAQPDVIMLDNMDMRTMELALIRMKTAKCTAKVEVSGGVSLKNVGDIARLRVDYISIGSITHSPRAIDISLRLAL